MTNWINWARGQLRGRPDSEHQQALIRVIIMGLVFLYFSTTALRGVTLLAGTYLAVSIAIFGSVNSQWKTNLTGLLVMV